jgi:ribosomal protein S8
LVEFLVYIKNYVGSTPTPSFLFSVNFKISIKQILARINVAEKKKDLKVNLSFKKELIPFLIALQSQGVIYRFRVKKKTIELTLKKKKPIFSNSSQGVVRDFRLEASRYRNPAILFFISTTVGV